jgi:uncharacterized protein (DUF305 family)
MTRPSLQPVTRQLVTATVLACLAACAKGDRTSDSTSTTGAGRTSATSTTAAAPAAVAHDSSSPRSAAAPTGDADHDFLRRMSDHHQGLIRLVHMTKDRKESSRAAIADATKIDTEQDRELDQMVTMLERDFKDPYAPKPMPEHQAMAGTLKTKTGVDYDRTFYRDVVQHHREGIAMIDDYLPKSKNPTVKRMAERMRAEQTREIAALEQKLSKLRG